MPIKLPKQRLRKPNVTRHSIHRQMVLWDVVREPFFLHDPVRFKGVTGLAIYAVNGMVEVALMTKDRKVDYHWIDSSKLEWNSKVRSNTII